MGRGIIWEREPNGSHLQPVLAIKISPITESSEEKAQADFGEGEALENGPWPGFFSQKIEEIAVRWAVPDPGTPCESSPFPGLLAVAQAGEPCIAKAPDRTPIHGIQTKGHPKTRPNIKPPLVEDGAGGTEKSSSKLFLTVLSKIFGERCASDEGAGPKELSVFPKAMSAELDGDRVELCGAKDKNPSSSGEEDPSEAAGGRGKGPANFEVCFAEACFIRACQGEGVEPGLGFDEK
jgi:hypothetical protein